MKACQCCRRRQAARRSPNCSACNMKAWRAKNPLDAHFNWLKRSAEKRRIPFLLTKEEFRVWCEQTSYLQLVGVNAMSCDRIDPERGYESDNIRILSYRENARLGAVHLWRKRKGAKA